MSQHGVPHHRMGEIGRIWIVRGLNWTFSYVRDEIEPNTIVHGRIRLFFPGLPLPLGDVFPDIIWELGKGKGLLKKISQKFIKIEN